MLARQEDWRDFVAAVVKLSEHAAEL